MVDRVELLGVLIRSGEPSAARVVKIHQQLDKALSIALEEISLDKARDLSGSERGELVNTLRSILTIADLKKVAKVWEPKRKIDGSASQTEVAEALVALLQGERDPYVSCTTFTLAQARVLGHDERRALGDSIARWAPEADLRKLAKKWDKNNDVLADMNLSKLRLALLALLQERAEPAKNR
jgi:hypothetical protein